MELPESSENRATWKAIGIQCGMGHCEYIYCQAVKDIAKSSYGIAKIVWK